MPPKKNWQYSAKNDWPRQGGEWRHPDRWRDPAHWRGRPGAIFFRLAFLFGLMALLIVAGMAVLAFLLSRLFGGDSQIGTLVWIAGCSISLALPGLAWMLGMRAFRGIAAPLGDVMEAADRVAEGDFTVRVSERGRRDFRQLASSFNRMAEELARADQQRRNLTADVAHELRNPLHILQGNLEGILDGVYEPSGEQIQSMLEETQLLSRLVEDLGTLSLAEAGQLKLAVSHVDLAGLLSDVATSFEGPAEAAGVQLQVRAQPDLQIEADPARLDQVLGNLVGNAIRHTAPGGEIVLQAECVAADRQAASEGIVLIRVRDNGAGISEEDLPFIFDRFWKGDRARTRGSGSGSGLGLAIARQLVQAHHGKITVESRLGAGTTFHIQLPLTQPA